MKVKIQTLNSVYQIIVYSKIRNRISSKSRQISAISMNKLIILCYDYNLKFKLNCCSLWFILYNCTQLEQMLYSLVLSKQLNYLYIFTTISSYVYCEYLKYINIEIRNINIIINKYIHRYIQNSNSYEII